MTTPTVGSEAVEARNKLSDSDIRRASAKPNLRDWVGAPKGNWSNHEPVSGIKGLRRAQVDSGQAVADKISRWAAGTNLVKKSPRLAELIAKNGAKTLPVIGSIAAGVAAWDDFSHGRPLAGALDVVGMIPGPIGWLAIGASFVCEWNGWGELGATHYGLWDKPGPADNGNTTFMLPASAAAEVGVMESDKAITQSQKEVFGFLDGPTGTVWDANHPNPLVLNTPAVQTALITWMKDIADTFKQINNELISRNEPYMEKAQQHLQAHLSAMAKMPDNAVPITAQLDAASTAAGSWYAAVLAANSDARAALSQGSSVSDPTSVLTNEQTKNQAAITAANDKLKAVVDGNSLGTLAPPPRLAPPQRTTAPKPGMDQPWVPTPLPPAGPPLTPPPTTEKEKPKDDVSDILSKLGNNLGGSPLGGAPLGGGMPLGGMPMGGLGGGAPLGGGTPLAQPVPKPLAPEPKPVLATERNSLAGTPVENKLVPAAAEKKVDAAAAEKKDAPVVGAAAAAKPGEPAIKPAASTKSAPDHTVDVKGKKITFPDAKTAALATELGKSAPGSPASLADAATKAGLVPPVAGQDPGQQVAPPNAKPGDLLVAGDKSYMNLGDGNFLDYSNGKVVDADQMSKDLGPKGGYFHLVDAAAGAQPGPVSGQTPDTTTFTVADTPKVPVDAGADAAPTPAAASVPPGAVQAPAGVTSAGSPGVPNQGAPGSGPANAAATDTGRGVGTLASGQKPLDPTAIK